MAKRQIEEKKTFTTRDPGGKTVVIYQKPKWARDERGAPLEVTQHSITVRLQKGVKFDPYIECGETGKNKKFQSIEPSTMERFLIKQVATGTNGVCFWEQRPMTETEKAREREIKQYRDENEELRAANADLQALLDKATK